MGEAPRAEPARALDVPAAGLSPAAALDDAAFSEVVRTHAPGLLGFVVRAVGDHALAEDLVQEALLRAWRGRADFRGESSVKGWLYVIAGNVVRDDARRRRRRPGETTLDLDAHDSARADAAAAQDPARQVEGRDALARLKVAMEGLNPRHREMLVLREREGMSYAEIAAALDCPVGSVMSGLSRARERLVREVGR